MPTMLRYSKKGQDIVNKLLPNNILAHKYPKTEMQRRIDKALLVQNTSRIRTQ